MVLGAIFRKKFPPSPVEQPVSPFPGLSDEQQTFDRLYALMPPVEQVGPLLVVKRWFLRMGSIKTTSDFLSFVLKSLPAFLTVVSIPILSVAAFIYKGAVKQNFQISPTLFVIVLTCLITLSLSYLISAFMDQRLHRKLIQFDEHADFKIVQYVVVAYIISESRAIYAFRYLVEPRRDDLEYFPVKFNWSGEGGVRVFPRNSRYTVNGPTKVAGNFSRIEILLNKEARKNTQIPVEFSLVTADSTSTLPVRHLGVSITSKKYPIFNSHLITLFSETCIPISLARQYYLGGFGLSPVDIKYATLGSDRSYHWSLKPIFNWSYCIAWDFGR